jgi:hypothetical protein
MPSRLGSRHWCAGTPRERPKQNSGPWSNTWTNSGSRWRGRALLTTASGKRPRHQALLQQYGGGQRLNQRNIEFNTERKAALEKSQEPCSIW